MERSSRRLLTVCSWSTIAAFAFAGAAAIFCVPYFAVERFSLREILSSTDWTLAFASVLAAFLVGGGSWVFVEVRFSERWIRGGVVSGFFAGTVSHPLAFFLAGVLAGELYYAFLFPIASLGSLVLFGWLTALLGIVAGCTVGCLRLVTSRLHRRLSAA